MCMAPGLVERSKIAAGRDDAVIEVDGLLSGCSGSLPVKLASI